MSEEELRALRKIKKEFEEAYAEVKGLIEGVRIGGKLTPIEGSILRLLEFIVKIFKSLKDDILSIYEKQINTAQEVNGLKIKVKELEEAINQLRTTLDTLGESR